MLCLCNTISELLSSSYRSLPLANSEQKFDYHWLFHGKLFNYDRQAAGHFISSSDAFLLKPLITANPTKV